MSLHGSSSNDGAAAGILAFAGTLKVAAIFLTVFALVGLPTFFAFSDFRLPNYNQGYKPQQPIPFSHKLHAGDMGIDCQFCHTGAEKGRHAGIPSTSTCVGCHNGNFCLGSENGAQWVSKMRDMHTRNEPIQWVRIHNLPDHAYFNHSAHVTKGIACQDCHGPVETMEVVEQFAPLSMGWCVNCHRDKNAESKSALAAFGKLSDAEKATRKEPMKLNAPLDCAACHR